MSCHASEALVDQWYRETSAGGSGAAVVGPHVRPKAKKFGEATHVDSSLEEAVPSRCVKRRKEHAMGLLLRSNTRLQHVTCKGEEGRRELFSLERQSGDGRRMDLDFIYYFIQHITLLANLTVSLNWEPFENTTIAQNDH